MKTKNSRIEALKMLISSNDLGSQEEVLQALQSEGFKLTQATLSRDMKQLKVAKAASMNGKYIYVLPNETMYRRVPSPRTAYNIDNAEIADILGTIAGDDTIFMVVKEGADKDALSAELDKIMRGVM